MPYENPRSSKILTSKDQIKLFLGGIGDDVFKKYVKQGMPAYFEKGVGWSAHVENLEEWWKGRTRTSMAQYLDQIQD